MKFESFIAPSDIPSKARYKSQARIDAEVAVGQFIERFIYEPTKVGPVLNIVDPADGPADWMPATEYARADKAAKKLVRSRMTARLRLVLIECKAQVKKLASPQFRGRFSLATAYLGDGKVALYWRLKHRERVLTSAIGYKGVRPHDLIAGDVNERAAEKFAQGAGK